MTNNWELHRIERIEKWLKRVSQDQYVHQVPLSLCYAYSAPFLSLTDAQNLEFAPISEGDEWGRNNRLAWFRITGTVPADWELPASLLVNISGELLLYGSDGCPVYGLTNGSVFDPRMIRDRYLLPEALCSDDGFTIYGEAVATSIFGLYNAVRDHEAVLRKTPEERPAPSHIARVLEARLVAIDPVRASLFRQGTLLLDQMKSLPETSMRRGKLVRQINKAIDAYEREEIPESAALVEACLKDPAHATELTYTAIGHAHIDTAWLWRMEESIRKCARTFSSQLAHIERYPGYVFGASSPHHYVWMEQHYPALFERIKEQVQAGRWECLGAMWVEADCNISGGEALARQLIYGKRYFQSTFGVDVRHLWLPDVFGYSACLPQLLQQVRAPYFMTTKISWNRYNKFPYASFHWKGLDGTTVLSHLPPTNDYNEMLVPSRLCQGRDQYPEKNIAPEALVVYGIGDGGGGPHESHIEDGLLLENLEAAPKVKFGTVDDFFTVLQEYADELPTWDGELYLEMHRGTLTTQAAIKAGNRRIEHRLRDTEMLYASGALDRYPQAEIEALWKKFLVHQFHDILPGSCIEEAAADTHQEYAEIETELDALWAPWKEKSADKWTVVNSLNFERDDIVRLPIKSEYAISQDGKYLATQSVDDETWIHLDQSGLTSMPLQESEKTAAPTLQQILAPADFPLTLENELVLYRINANGQIIFARDKTCDRIFIEGEVANELALYADHPTRWDAWDVDPFYPNSQTGTAECNGTVHYEQGAVAQILTIPLTVGNSTVSLRIILPNHRATLEIECSVDWHEKHRMLRVNVPTTVQSSTAGFHVQFGLIKRNTCDNTSQDQAQFEVAAHEFADLSEEDFGVALINDCKYGYKVKGRTLSMTLLRAPDYPDRNADIGHHTFRYAIQPHAGTLSRSNVIETAAAFNQPRWVLPGTDAVDFPIQLTGESVRLETLKKAEDSNDLIIRFYECKGRSTPAELTVKQACFIEEVNLLEETQIEAGSFFAGETLVQHLHPFEICTLKIRPSLQN
ncbi:MAG: alpha-mannosidase [Pontiellaceae bacterium]|nr:alpha-mannosidase [Pontiellaceae bacterium]MBN2785050.1 alpha-mannosidase [Pontiellaceae bacterium]